MAERDPKPKETKNKTKKKRQKNGAKPHGTIIGTAKPATDEVTNLQKRQKKKQNVVVVANIVIIIVNLSQQLQFF